MLFLDFLLQNSHIFAGVGLIALFILLLIFGFKYRPTNPFMVGFDLVYERVYYFYEGILGKEEKSSVKAYVVTLFFVILFANLLGVILDFVAPIFGTSDAGSFQLLYYVLLPTASLEFTLAVSAFSVLLMLYIQFRTLGLKGFFIHYIPVNGKKYFVLDKKKHSTFHYYLLYPFVKILDLVLSFFLAFLDIIGIFARVISLGFRLFGNVTSSTALLGMVLVGTSAASLYLTGFIGGYELPIIFPVIVVLQGLLIAVIQAMVFSLLVAIFIRIAQMQEKG